MAIIAILAALVPAVLVTVALIVVMLRRPEVIVHTWQVIAGYGFIMIVLAGMELAVLIPALKH